jgi:hypothetical protein
MAASVIACGEPAAAGSGGGHAGGAQALLVP